MREKIAQSLLIMYGAGLNDGQQGIAHPSIVITDQLDKLTKELSEEIEKIRKLPHKRLDEGATPEEPAYYHGFDEACDEFLSLFCS